MRIGRDVRLRRCRPYGRRGGARPPRGDGPRHGEGSPRGHRPLDLLLPRLQPGALAGGEPLDPPQQQHLPQREAAFSRAAACQSPPLMGPDCHVAIRSAHRLFSASLPGEAAPSTRSRPLGKPVGQ